MDAFTRNRRVWPRLGAAVVLREDAFTPDSLAETLRMLIEDPVKLTAMAAAASAVARPDAADRLADLVEETAA